MGNIFTKIKRVYMCIIIVIGLILVLGIVFSVIYLLNQLGILSDDDLASFTEISGSSGSTFIASNGDFLEIARDCHAWLRENNFTYVNGQNIPITSSSSGIDCSSYVCWALYEYGYSDLAGWQKSCSGGTLVQWCNANLEMVWSGFTHYVTDITDIQAGDICIMGASSQQGGTVTTHTQIFAGYTSSGIGIWYNCGSDSSIAKVEGTNQYNSYTYNGCGLLYVYRVPSLT